MFAAMSRFRRTSRKAPIFICAVCTALVAGQYFAGQVVDSIQISFLRRLSGFKPLESAEFYTQDSLARYFGKRAKPDPELVYLCIDHNSVVLDQFDPAEIEASPALRLMKRDWPWPREVYPLILERLIHAGAKVVALDLMFPTPREGDGAFRAALDKHRNHVVVGSNFVVGKAEENNVEGNQIPAETLIPQTSPLDDRIGFVNFWPDPDGIIRRVHYHVMASEVFKTAPLPGEEIIDSLAARTLEKGGRAGSIPPATAPRRIRFAGGADTFTPHSVSDIFDAQNWSHRYGNGDFFRNKIVLLGPAGNFLKDVVRTPFGEMSGPEMHLNAMNAALNGDFVAGTSEITNSLLIALGGFLAWVLCMKFFAPLLRLAMLVATGAAWLVIAQILYNHASLFILTFAPLAALGSSGVCCLSWDFFIERREKLRVRRTLELHVSDEVAREILDNPESYFHTLGGVRKPMAVLFSDLRGFTAMTEQSDSQELVRQLNDYFSAMVEPILAQQGVLDKFIGDAIMAVWGSLRSRGTVEETKAAVTCALRMREALIALNSRWKTNGGKPLAMGIGINFGEAIVGNIGSIKRSNLTVIGDTVNLASRIEGVTKEYGVDLLLGEEAASQVRDLFYMQSAGLAQVQGRKRPVELFTVLGERTATPDPQLDGYLRVHAGAMALYVRGDFTAAGARFEEAHALRPADPLPPVYIKRCALLAQQPPDPNWNGVFVMTKK